MRLLILFAVVLPGHGVRRLTTLAEQINTQESGTALTGIRDQLLKCMEELGFQGNGGLDLHLPQIKRDIQEGIFLDLHMSGCTAAPSSNGEIVDARDDVYVQGVVANQADHLLSIGVADLCKRIRTGTTWAGVDCAAAPRASGRPIRTPSDAVAALRVWASMLICKMTEGYEELQDWGKKGMIRKAVKIAAKQAIVAVTAFLGAEQFTLAAETIEWSSVAVFLGDEYANTESITFRDQGVNLIASIALKVAAVLVHDHIPLEELVTHGTEAVVNGILDMDSAVRRTRADVEALERAKFSCRQHHDLEQEASSLKAVALGQQPLHSGSCKDNLMTPYAGVGSAEDRTMSKGCVCHTVAPWEAFFCADTHEATCTNINGHTGEVQMQERCNQHTKLGIDKAHRHCMWKPVFTDRTGSCVVPFDEDTMSVSRSQAGIDLANAWAACVCTHPENGEKARCSSFQVDGAWVDQSALRRQIVYAEETADETTISELTKKCGQATMKFSFHKDYTYCGWRITSTKLDGYKCYDTPELEAPRVSHDISQLYGPAELTRL